MSEKKDADEPEVKNKDFLVSCRVAPVFPDGSAIDVMDVVSAEDEEEAKDLVTAFVADRDYVVERWNAVAEVKTLRDVASVMSR